MSKKFFNIFFNICIVLISVCCIVFYTYSSFAHYFYGDDMADSIYEMGVNPFSGIFEDVEIMHGGGCVSLVLTRFFCFTLPVILNIHPADFMCWGSGFIQSLLLIVLFFSYLNFFPYVKKFKFLKTSLFLFTGAYFFYMLEYTGSAFIYSNNNNFWRYPFTFIFFNTLFFFLFKNAVYKNVVTSWGKYVFILGCTVISAVNNDYLMYVGLAVFGLMIVYDFITKILLKSKENLHIHLSFKNFYAILLLYACCIGFYVNTTAYKFIHGYRTNFGDFSFLKDVIVDFTKTYFQVLFVNYKYYWIIFAVILLLCLILANKKKEYSKIAIPLFIITANLAVMFSLVFCQYNGMGDRYWITRETLQLSYVMCCYLSLLMLFNYLYKHIRNHKIIKIYFLSVVLIASSGFLIYKTSGVDKSSAYIKSINYVADKMLRFYYLKNETPILYQYEPAHKSSDCCIYNYEYIRRNIDKIESFKKGNMICTKDNPYVLDYFTKTYKEDREKVKELGICFSPDAFERFYEKGGTFSEEEFKNITFTKLKNDSFVLEKQSEPIDVKEKFLDKLIF